MADAILQQLDGELAGLFPVGDGIEAQNSGELLVGQRPGIAHAVLLANKHTSALGDRDTSRLRDRLRAVAHKLGAHGVTVAEEQSANLLALYLGHEVAALSAELGHHGIAVAGLADDALLGGTNRAVVKRLGGEDAADGVVYIGAALDVGGRVASTHAQCGLAGAVGGLDHAGTAGSDDHGDLGSMHELVGGSHGGKRDALDHVLGGTRLDSCLVHELDGHTRALGGSGMRREDDSVTRLEGDHRLVDDRRGGVGGGNDAHQQTNRLGDGDDLVLLVGVDNADGLLVADLLIEQGAGDMVLVHLVANLAKARLLDSHAGEHLGVFLGNLHHVTEDAVDLLLVVMSKLVRSDLTLAGEIANRLDALKIEIVVLHESPFESIG